MVPANTTKISKEMFLEIDLESRKVSQELEKYLGMANIVKFVAFDSYQKSKSLGKMVIFLKKIFFNTKREKQQS